MGADRLANALRLEIDALVSRALGDLMHLIFSSSSSLSIVCALGQCQLLEHLRCSRGRRRALDCVPMGARWRGLLACLVAALVSVAPAGAQQRLNLPVPPPGSPVWGGVPQPQLAAAPITLTLRDALRLALEHNLSVLLAEESVDRA